MDDALLNLPTCAPTPAAGLLQAFKPLRGNVLYKEDFGVVWFYPRDFPAGRPIFVYEWSGGFPDDVAEAVLGLRYVTQEEFDAIESAFNARCAAGAR